MIGSSSNRPRLTRNTPAAGRGCLNLPTTRLTRGTSVSLRNLNANWNVGAVRAETVTTDVEDRIGKAASLIAYHDRLNPFDKAGFNRAALVWEAISEVPPEHRRKILSDLKSQDIIRLWKDVSPERFAAAKRVDLPFGSFSVRDDFPTEPGEVAYFDGVAALPFTMLKANRFQKAFFVDPESFDMYGRVLVQRGALGDFLYPGYFKTSFETTSISATKEIADVALEYLQPDSLNLSKELLPVASWPVPKNQLFPFHGGLVDYLRPIGPGVYVGVGWRAPRPAKNDLGRRFLFFVLAKVVKISND